MNQIIILLVSILATSAVAKVDNEQVHLAELAYYEAVNNGVDPDKFISLINCESGFNRYARGDYDKKTGRHLSLGLLQYQKPTFDAYSKKYGIEGEYLDPIVQIKLAAKMIGDGGEKHWFHCSRKAGLR